MVLAEATNVFFYRFWDKDVKQLLALNYLWPNSKGELYLVMIMLCRCVIACGQLIREVMCKTSYDSHAVNEMLMP